MKKKLFLAATLFIVAGSSFMFSCSKKSAEPATIVTIDTTTLNLGTIKSRDTSIVKTIQIGMTGTQPVTWTAVSNQNWLTVSPTSSTVTTVGSNVSTIIKTAGLSPGAYEGNVIVSSKINGTAQADKVIKVKFVIDVKKVIDVTKVIDGYTLTANETWSGNIYLRGDIVIPAAYSLTIDPGTNIKIAASNLIYDDGLNTKAVEFIIYGSMLVNGVKAKPVQFYSENNSKDNSLWTGIFFYGKNFAMTYCSVINADVGFDYNPSASNNITSISNSFFGSNFNATNNYSNGANVLNITNVTFDGNKEAIHTVNSGGTDNITGCDFKNNSLGDYYLASSGSIFNITNNNFDKIPVNVWIASFNKNCTFNLKNNYGIDLFDESNKINKGTNTISQTNATTPNQNVGCGFTPTFVAM